MKIKTLITSLLLAFAFNGFTQNFKSYPVNSIDPDYDSFADLNFLKREIGEAQIVLIGEQDHGDGATFLAKTRLIKYLVEEMGFSALAFEGDFISLNDSLLSVSEKWNALPGIWKNSDQMTPLREYLTDREIQLAGFDIFGTVAKEQFGNLFWQLASPFTGYSEEDIKNTLNAIFYGTKTNRKSREEVFRITPLLIEQQSGFKKQILISFQYTIESYRKLNEKRSGFEKYRERDTQMGINLKWLMENPLRGKKVIVWAANWHIAKNPNAINDNKNWRFESGNLMTMGQKFSEISNLKTYTIATTSYSGKYSEWMEGPDMLVEIKPTRHDEESLELLLNSQSNDFVFIPLAGLSFSYSLSGFVHQSFHGDWSRVFDAVFFIRQMTPSTYNQNK